MYLKKLIFLLTINFYIFSNIDQSNFVQNPKIVIFDIGGTLITTDAIKFPKYFGYLNFFGCIFGSIFKGDSTIFNMKDFYLDMLGQIPSVFNNLPYEVRGLTGKSLPPLQRDSFLGILSLKDCLIIGNEWIEKNAHKFKNNYQKKIFKKIFNFNFDATTLIKNQKYTQTIKLLKKLYLSKDKNGKRKNICLILSNQPKEAIPLLRLYFPEIFKFSDNQIFSCNEGYIKPHYLLFQKCFDCCPCDCFKTCFFIDDEKFNIETSKLLNIKKYSIVSVYPNEAEKVLADFGLI